MVDKLSRRFVSQALFEDAWLDACDERVIERPNGGSGDSCIVSRLTIAKQNGHQAHPPQRFSYIAKRVAGPSERHAAYDALKTEIKRVSYKVEADVLMALKPLRLESIAELVFWLDESSSTSVLIEEDLVARGFPVHVGEMNQQQLFKAIDWLGKFHHSTMHYLQQQQQGGGGRRPGGMAWQRGGYWSLDKRSDELCKMQSRWEQTKELDELPSNFAKRLHMSSRALDQLLYPGAARLAFDQEEEGRMYGPEDEVSAEETSRREHTRRAQSSKVTHQMLVPIMQWHYTAPPPGASVYVAQAASSRFLRPTLIHGDYKGENIFFSKDTLRCAVCDFQWGGFGLGVLDVVSLLFSSLPPHLSNDRFIDKALDRYAGGGGGQDCSKRERGVLRFLFDFAVVDYARYVVGTGQLFQEDLFLLQYANHVLNRLDRGTVLADELMYDDELRKIQLQL